MQRTKKLTGGDEVATFVEEPRSASTYLRLRARVILKVRQQVSKKFRTNEHFTPCLFLLPHVLRAFVFDTFGGLALHRNSEKGGNDRGSATRCLLR